MLALSLVSVNTQADFSASSWTGTKSSCGLINDKTTFTIHVQTQNFKPLVVSDSLIESFICLSLWALILEAHTSERERKKVLVK